MDEKTKNPFELNRVRENFPILDQDINGSKLIYFDNAASTQKPSRVIKSIKQYYESDHSNVHRGVHSLSIRATESYEKSRRVISSYINAKHEHEVIHTKGTTEAINLVAQSISDQIKENDEILISAMEHHSNIVPWQELCKRTGACLKVIPINEAGEINLDEMNRLISSKTRIISITHVSNTLGTINPIKKIINLAKSVDALTLIDGAQAAAHMRIDVQDIDCDFYVFSGHKLYGPTGTGVLYGKEEILNSLNPYQYGGEMILKVTFDETTYNSLPHKFEAGTPNIAGAIGLMHAIEYLKEIDFDSAIDHEMTVHDYALKQLKLLPNLKIIGAAKDKSSIISFTIGELHPHDVGTILNQKAVAVRTGHHCTMPLMDFYQIPGTIRASFSFYNSKEEVDVLISALEIATEMLS
ncbi:MAG: cysteine desulfurase [Gammaproteobacteria bacterium]|nr:cysteine desulfurase [Gammaproteobacteria bacterium]|tara:strand:+ start:831 stop:2066 length:1236 start_codon:yes stop_codon:yes gene_type:complete